LIFKKYYVNHIGIIGSLNVQNEACTGNTSGFAQDDEMLKGGKSMKGFNKMIASVLTTAALASSMGAFAAVPGDVAGTRYENPIQVLAALGIMVGDGDGNFRPGDTIIRSEVTKMVIHALGLEDAAAAATGLSKFPDVPSNHWANGYINLATSQKIVIGDEKGNFRPDDKITYAEAMTIFVRALGYEKSAQNKGGFPQGYLVVGSDNGMSKGIANTANSEISRGDVAVLVNNSLEVKLMELTEFGENPKYEVTEKTLLKDKLNTTKASGQIVAIESTSLEGASNLTSGQIKIGDSIFDARENFNNLFGHNVDYYVQETDSGSKELILAIPQKDKNVTVSMTADLFESVTLKNDAYVLEYFKKETDNKASSVTLETDAIMIYNGKYEPISAELMNLKDKSGKIVVLDTDRNGKYDIVFVTEYTNMVVEEVTATNKIVDKYNAPTLKLDKEEDEDLIFTIKRGLETLKLSDLKEFDVLSIAASKDKQFYDIIVTNKSVEGKITGMSGDGFFINGEEYKLAANYPNSITIGTEGVFYLDVEGKVAAIDTTARVTGNYAYLIKAYANITTDETAEFKLFTKEGKEVTLQATEKIRFNGKSGNRAIDVVEQLQKDGQTVKQLITYSTNSDGKIVSIHTAKDNTATGAADEDTFTMNYKLENAVFNAKLNKIGNVKITADTIIFDIPEGSTDYSIASLDMFEDEQKYNVIVFDRTEDFAAKAIVVTNAAFQTNADSAIAVVQKVVSSTNADDEITDRLFALQGGKEVQVNAEEQGILVKGEAKALQAGDIIQYKTNAKGEIVNIRVLMDIQTKTTEKQETPVENLDIIYGKVSKKFTGSINVTVNDGEVLNIQLPSDVIVYSVDSTKTKNPVTVATAGDIQAFDADEGNRVFVKIYKDVVQEVVIIK